MRQDGRNVDGDALTFASGWGGMFMVMFNICVRMGGMLMAKLLQLRQDGEECLWRCFSTCVRMGKNIHGDALLRHMQNWEGWVCFQGELRCNE